MSSDPSATDHPGPAKDVTGLVLVSILIGVVALGLLAVAPGVAILLLVLLAPVLVRASTGPPQAGAGTPPTGTQKTLGFLGSLGVLVGVGLAAVAAFYATCFVVCLGGLAVADLGKSGNYEWIIVPSVGAGLAVGGWVFVRMFRWWTRKG